MAGPREKKCIYFFIILLFLKQRESEGFFLVTEVKVGLRAGFRRSVK